MLPGYHHSQKSWLRRRLGRWETEGIYPTHFLEVLLLTFKSLHTVYFASRALYSPFLSLLTPPFFTNLPYMLPPSAFVNLTHQVIGIMLCNQGLLLNHVPCLKETILSMCFFETIWLCDISLPRFMQPASRDFYNAFSLYVTWWKNRDLNKKILTNH